ncbi:GAF domain-containing protein, partial [Candidatus Calescamantes bacterium]|nr:GAF domain-containing protein [Candidatus Calescamantes bacterium]
HFVSLGPTMTVVIVGFITYAIVRYRLFDITVALKKTLLYTLLTGLVTAVYMISILLTERFLRGLTGYQSFIPVFLVSIFLAFTFLPIREKLQSFVDKVFFRKRYDYTKILRETAEELAKELNLGALLKFIVDNVSEAMGIEKASIWLKRGKFFHPLFYKNLSSEQLKPFSENSSIIKWLKKEKDVVIREELEKMRPVYLVREMDKELERVGAEIGVPIIREKDITGMIFLSNKKSGDIFTQEDINLLLTIASQAGTALENAILYDEAQSARIFQENILANMVSGVIGIEKKGIIRIFNERAGKFLNLKPSRVVGHDFRRIIGGEIRWVIDQVYMNRRTVSRWEIKTPEETSPQTETQYTIGVTGVPLIDKKGEFSGVLIVMVDLTEIRRLEGELHHFERLAAVGKLAATLAHEIKNPLSSILTFIQLAREGNRDPELYTGFVEVAYGEAQRINNLLQELLDISRPEKLTMEKYNINKLVRETILFLKPEAEKSGVSLVENLEEKIPPFPIDKNRLKQVIINLGMNAIEAMQKGGVLSLSTYYELIEEGFGKCVLSIKDNGKGIAEEEIPYIFDIFYTTKKGGNGLGLALVKKIVEAHGGNIEVFSELGKGTEFRVILPMRIKSVSELIEVR